MREYARISPKFWTGETGRQLRKMGDPALVIAMYLLTCPNANMLGLYYLPLPTIAHETGRPLEGARKALRRVCEAGFAYYDEDSEMVWVPEMARFQIGEALDPKDKQVGGVVRELVSLIKCRFAKDFYNKYKDAFSLTVDPKHKALLSPFEAPSKPHRSQEQEQEQEKEQEKEQEQDPPPPPLGAPQVSTREAIDEIVASWNRIPGVTPVKSVTGPIRDRLLVRLREHPNTGWWAQLFECVARSDFLCGRKGDWSATLDWCLGPKNLSKILAGNYENRAVIPMRAVPKSMVDLL